MAIPTNPLKEASVSDPIPLSELKASFFRRCDELATFLDCELADTDAAQAMLSPPERDSVRRGEQPDLPLTRWAMLFFRLSDDLQSRELSAALEWHDYMTAHGREYCRCDSYSDYYTQGDFAVDEDDIPF